MGGTQHTLSEMASLIYRSSKSPGILHPVPLHLHYPRAPLGSFIQVMCVSENYRPEHALERVLPDGSMTLAVLLEADALRVYEPDGTIRLPSIRDSLTCGPHSTF